jgi:hypothetical protein
VTRPCIGSQLRITRRDGGGRRTTLRLEGRLDRSGWEALAAARADCADRLVALDLSGLAFVAWDAARSLAALRREGVGLRGASGFVRELLRTATASERSEDALATGSRSEADGRPAPAARMEES